ncbi:hypothetical protein P4573_14275 [Priestia megaterium]|uniref:hypothetical protein n=1 Tax=Priestia megaterium TaxID=1404 RepID=UPI002E1CC56A|nr:hypothetical protein [Priestia megaterium]
MTKKYKKRCNCNLCKINNDPIVTTEGYPPFNTPTPPFIPVNSFRRSGGFGDFGGFGFPPSSPNSSQIPDISPFGTTTPPVIIASNPKIIIIL